MLPDEVETLRGLLMDARSEIRRYREGIEVFLRAQGHDLCHENRAQLAELIDRPELATPPLRIQALGTRPKWNRSWLDAPAA